MVLAFVCVSVGRLKALTDAGQPAPAWSKIRALVDTGASCTCVDTQILLGLGLTPTGRTQVAVPGRAPEEHDQYDVGLVIPAAVQGDPQLSFPTIPVVATPLLSALGFDALIGRDILEECLFAYNGSAKTFTLAY